MAACLRERELFHHFPRVVPRCRVLPLVDKVDPVGLQVVENWNSANKDLFYGKDGDLAGSDKESQEVSMLALHLLQSALVHVNTLLMQQVLADPKWADTLTDADRRALSPLFWTHVNPYGWFELDMNSRLELDMTATATTVPSPAQPARRGGTGRNVTPRF
ncbi:transposase [Streptomyces sp. 8K308]|uniref:transposase n=1 Tax=Streptomyces sp. 8K308 TaxID=2530388 RepID=UPI001FB7A377|nr:transposase [Streptomyces sp. 8K308]